MRTLLVGEDEAELRLDRWFRRRFPGLGHGRLEKLLRTGQVRLDGKRAKAGDRVAPGQSVRIPPLDESAETAAPPPPRAEPRPKDVAAVLGAIIHRDDDILVLDKPPGLAVQGGTGTDRHLDLLLDELRFGAAERPRLVHRLDKDTSGVLVLARDAVAAAKLAAAFRGRETRKLYWAITVGVPTPRQGRIDLPLGKIAGRAGERVAADPEEGKGAVTLYRVVEHAAKRAALVALSPITGRTHQLRVHAAAALQTPILGDGKYGGATAHLQGVAGNRQLHLHARSLAFPHPRGGVFHIAAKPPLHMRRTFEFFGFTGEDADDLDWLER